MWGDYNYNEAVKLGYITGTSNKTKDKLLERLSIKWDEDEIYIPHDFNREFFIYRQDKDIFGNEVKKKAEV